MTDAKILIVEDDESGAAHLEECLKNLGYAVCDAVSCGREAIEKAADMRPDLALVDLRLEGEVTGLETAAQIGSRFDVPVVYLTDEAEGNLLLRAQATNSFGYVLRPFEARQLHLNIQTAISMHERECRQRETEIRLKRIIKRLKDFTRLMKTVFDSMSEGVVAVDENRMLLFNNSVAKRLGGDIPLDEDIDKWAEKYGVFQPDGKTLVTKDKSPLTLALSGKATDDVEVLVRNEKKPEGVHVSVSGRPLRGKAGALKGGVLVCRDITMIKRTEAALERTIAQQQDQARLMETIFSSISDGVLVANAEGKFTFFNPSAEQIIGVGMLNLKPQQWKGEYGVFYPDKKNRMPTAQLSLVRAVRGEATDEIEMFIRNEQKSEGVYISVSGRPLHTNVGGHGGGVIIFRDITKQKKAAAELGKTMEELRKQSELMETTFKSISDGIIVADVTGQSFYVNPAAEQIVGMNITTDHLPEEWVERYGLFYPDRETPVRMEDMPFLHIFSRGESMDEMDLFIRNQNRPDGVYIRVSGRPLLDNLGGIRGGVIIFRDVTERMLAEEALAQAFAQGRLEVVDTILHNIGNAINSVTTGIETVRQNLVNDHVGRRLFALAAAVREHQDDWSDYIENDPQGRKVMPFIIALSENFSKRSEGLIKTVGRVWDRANHIADIVRTQKALGSPTMTRKDIDLHDALSAAVRVLRDSLNKKGIHTDIDCEYAPREISIQESQFHQMLVNLVKNSIEAIDDLTLAQGLDEAPHIQIRASAEDDFLKLEVSDSARDPPRL